MSKLSTAARNRLSNRSFALPGRRYPVEDKAHAANARARVAQHGTPAEKKTVFRKTAHFFKGVVGKVGNKVAGRG